VLLGWCSLALAASPATHTGPRWCTLFAWGVGQRCFTGQLPCAQDGPLRSKQPLRRTQGAPCADGEPAVSPAPLGSQAMGATDFPASTWHLNHAHMKAMNTGVWRKRLLHRDRSRPPASRGWPAARLRTPSRCFALIRRKWAEPANGICCCDERSCVSRGLQFATALACISLQPRVIFRSPLEHGGRPSEALASRAVEARPPAKWHAHVYFVDCHTIARPPQ